MQYTDPVAGFLDKVLWRNSAFCRSISDQIPSFQSVSLIHGDKNIVVGCDDEWIAKLDKGTGESPSLALVALEGMMIRDFPGKQLRRVYLVSDERGVSRVQVFKCDDGFLHATEKIQDSMNLSDFLFSNIEHRHILAIYSAGSDPCSFSNARAAIVSVFDGEGFMLLRQ